MDLKFLMQRTRKKVRAIPSNIKQGAIRKIERTKELWRKRVQLKQEGLQAYVPFAVLRGEQRRLWKRVLRVGAAKEFADGAIEVGIGEQMIREGYAKELWNLIVSSEARVAAEAAGSTGAIVLRGATFALITTKPDLVAFGTIIGMSFSERRKIRNAIRVCIGNPEMSRKLEKYYAPYPPINELLQKLGSELEVMPEERERIANAAFKILSVTKKEELADLNELRNSVLKRVKEKGYPKSFQKKAKTVFKREKQRIISRNPFTRPL